VNKQRYGGNRKSIWCLLIFKHKGNFRLENLFHSHLRRNHPNVEVHTSFHNFFRYQSLKGHKGESPPSAGLLRRPPTGSATTAGVANMSANPDGSRTCGTGSRNCGTSRGRGSPISSRSGYRKKSIVRW